jgi:hypothetical protein
MINSYLTDKIRIVTTTYTQNGAESSTDSSDIKARVEDINDLVLDSDGKEVLGNMLIICNKDITVASTNKVKIRKKHGLDYEMPDKKFQIKRISSYGMFKKKMYEIIV